MANRRQNVQRNRDEGPVPGAAEGQHAAIETQFPWYIQLGLYCWRNITVSNIWKCFLVIGIIAVAFILLIMGQPIVHAYFSAYDITIINRLNESCTHSLCRKDSVTFKGSDDMDIPNLYTVHIQVFPGITSLAGTHSIFVQIKCEAKGEVIIPLFNSGDLTGSRVLFIESDGVRPSSQAVLDTWSWSKGHNFGSHKITMNS